MAEGARELVDLVRAVEQQQAHVEALVDRLRRAERAVTQALTARAAVEAHRRADEAVLELEQAEQNLMTARRTRDAASRGAGRHRRQVAAAPPAEDVATLFDVG